MWLWLVISYLICAAIVLDLVDRGFRPDGHLDLVSPSA
jgi:hypothetical protein